MFSNALIKLQYSIGSPVKVGTSGPKYEAVALGGSAVVVYALYYDFVLAAAAANP